MEPEKPIGSPTSTRNRRRGLLQKQILHSPPANEHHSVPHIFSSPSTHRPRCNALLSRSLQRRLVYINSTANAQLQPTNAGSSSATGYVSEQRVTFITHHNIGALTQMLPGRETFRRKKPQDTLMEKCVANVVEIDGWQPLRRN